MNQIANILKEANIDPFAHHKVFVNGKTRVVTSLGHNVDKMVSALDAALIQGINDVDGIIDFVECQPKVFDSRSTAPNRLSNLGTKTLITSLKAHVRWYNGAKSGDRTFKQQFCNIFGADKAATAIKLEKELTKWSSEYWKPEAAKYIRSLDNACLVVKVKTKEPEVLPDPPAEINVPPEVIAPTEKALCKATKKDGSPCKGKALANGYCSFHKALAPAVEA